MFKAHTKAAGMIVAAALLAALCTAFSHPAAYASEVESPFTKTQDFAREIKEYVGDVADEAAAQAEAEALEGRRQSVVATFCSGGRARASTTWASTPATASTSTPPRAAAASCAPPSTTSPPTSPSASSSKDDSVYQRKRPSGRGYSKTIFVAFARMPCEFCDKMPVQKRWRYLPCQMIC